MLALGSVTLGHSLLPRRESQAAPTQDANLSYFTRGDVRFAYRVDMPQGPGPHPAVVLVHGAGQRQTIADLQGWLNRLLPMGLAVLRYDKRGTGASGGRYRDVEPRGSSAVIPELAADAAAALAQLRGLPGIDSRRVGFIGGSQAGWIIPEASTIAQPAFAIILSGPAVPVGVEIRHARMFDQALNSAALRADLRAFQGERGYDPRQALERMTTPAIWFLGEKDERVPVPETVAILEQIRDANKRDWTIRTYPEVNHNLRQIAKNEPVPWWDEVRTWLARVGTR
jgi:dipeptidyl aminopeptidase/acylaminoacyl peptidase